MDIQFEVLISAPCLAEVIIVLSTLAFHIFGILNFLFMNEIQLQSGNGIRVLALGFQVDFGFLNFILKIFDLRWQYAFFKQLPY